MCSLSLYSKNKIFHLFHDLEKIEKSQIEQHWKPLNLLVSLETSEVQLKTNTQNIPILKSYVLI